MSETAQVEIPNRALFKATEVCELARVQPYVLRSWEGEFPGLGVAKTAGAPRVYRRADVEQVLRIKHLLLVEGLTLAGARRRLEEETAPVAVDEPMIDELIGEARTAIDSRSARASERRHVSALGADGQRRRAGEVIAVRRREAVTRQIDAITSRVGTIVCGTAELSSVSLEEGLGK